MSSIYPRPARKSRMARHTLAEVAAAELLERIMRGELSPGAPLRLAELAAELDMSHMPVREGLRRLEAMGIVDIEPHKGARVREISVEDLEDTQRTRILLESRAIEMAAERFSDDDAKLAGHALQETLDLARAGDPFDARQAHAEFHFALYRASGSRWMVKAIEPVWQNSERYRFGGATSADRVAQSHREHEAILRACEAHDREAAVAALQDHLAGAAARIRESLEERLDRARSEGKR